MIAWVDISEDWTFFSENLNGIFATSYEFLAYSHLNLLELLSSSGFPISKLTKHRYSH